MEAGPDLADWLHVAPRTALLRLSETFHTREGEPIVYSLNHFLTNKVAFHIIRRVNVR